MVSLKGLATGIGSLPYTNVNIALDMIFKYTPEIPFWPQLPQRDVKEGMMTQFSEHLPCLEVSADGIFFNARNKDTQLEEFYGRVIAQDLGYFKISPAYAEGLYKLAGRLKDCDLDLIKCIKCHITGPFTFAASINDESGKSLLHDSVFMQVISKGLIMKALWQIEFFRKFGKPIILFLDEPFLGCFGSAYTPLNREDVTKELTEFCAAIKSTDVLTGVHCCGNTDWSIFTETPAMDIINFDASDYMDKFVLYAEEIKGFLERGGLICWGIVPTSEFTGAETPDLMVRNIKKGFSELIRKGIPENLLEENLLLSPACGLGNMEAVKAEKILRLLKQTSSFLR